MNGSMWALTACNNISGTISLLFGALFPVDEAILLLVDHLLNIV
jgi:hypothetical protein